MVSTSFPFDAIFTVYLFTMVPAKPQRGGVSRTSEARDGFQEFQDGFIRFLKGHPLGANFGE